MTSSPSEGPKNSDLQKPADLKTFFTQYRFILIAAFLCIVVILLLPGRMKLHAFSGLLSGTLVGLVPFFVAKFYQQVRTGTLALVACMLGGCVSGLFLVLPLALTFLVIISLRANRQDHTPKNSGE
ncbi:hypothetical protein K8S19_08015 [bacterium]|nr:hypothetical protein [bacterium]